MNLSRDQAGLAADATSVLVVEDDQSIAAQLNRQVELVDADGRQYDLTGKPNFALCRCGGSVNKPFCDGTHSRVGFQAAEAAVRAEDKAKE